MVEQQVYVPVEKNIGEWARSEFEALTRAYNLQLEGRTFLTKDEMVLAGQQIPVLSIDSVIDEITLRGSEDSAYRFHGLVDGTMTLSHGMESGFRAVRISNRLRVPYSVGVPEDSSLHLVSFAFDELILR